MDRVREVESKHRQLYKGNTPPWKEVYRKRCHDRLKNNRAAYLQKCRMSAEQTPGNGALLMVNSLMAEEWHCLRGNHTELPSLQTGTERLQFDGEDNIDQAIMIFEEIRQELVQQEQQRSFSEYEASMHHDEAALSATIERLRAVEVICPMCEKSELSLNKGIIDCECGLRIDTEQDCVTLAFLKANLAEGTSLHGRACCQRPQFAVVQQMGVDNLVITCQGCDFLYIVV